MKNITLIGSSQGKHIANLLNKNGFKAIYIQEKNKNLLHKIRLAYRCIVSDYIYMVFVEHKPNDKFIRFLKLFNKKVIFHWIGTDVYNCINGSKTNYEYQLNVTHLSGSKLLHDELKNIGIESIIIPIIPFSMDLSIMEMPNTHRILNYIPQGKEEFYAADIVVNLANRNKNIIFDVVGTEKFEKIKIIPENIYFHGRVSNTAMNKIYKNITILFRFPKHDGLSMMVIEALAKGKYIIYKYKHPYVYTPTSSNIEDIDQTLKKILKLKPEINYRGHDYVKEHYNEKKMMELYKENNVFGE